MAELVASFGTAGAVPVLLSSDPSDHHRAAPADHVGRVESVEIEGNFLIATLSLPDPSHRARLLTGTLDVSAGIEFEVSGYGAVLSHLAVTPTPFVDGLGEFALAASERRARGEMVCFADVPASSLHSREPQTPEEALRAAQRERMRTGARPARPVYARPLADRVAEMKSALGRDDGGDLEQRIANMKASLGRK
jgi:hypothetical protein